MSFDNETSPDATNGETQATKSGGWKKILGGIGCLGLIAVCIVIVISLRHSNKTAVSEEARSFVQGSTVVQKHLGSPVMINEERGNPGADKSFIFEFDISGPEGAGTATVNMTHDDESSALVLGQSSLDFNGETIDLNAKDEFSFELEGMDDF